MQKLGQKTPRYRRVAVSMSIASGFTMVTKDHARTPPIASRMSTASTCELAVVVLLDVGVRWIHYGGCITCTK